MICCRIGNKPCENAPNAFINIASYEKDDYLATIDSNDVERTQAFPIIRGRLTAIGGVEANEYSDTSEGTDALSRRSTLRGRRSTSL